MITNILNNEEVDEISDDEDNSLKDKSVQY